MTKRHHVGKGRKHAPVREYEIEGPSHTGGRAYGRNAREAVEDFCKSYPHKAHLCDKLTAWRIPVRRKK
jgi:hypothetical protein